MNNEDLIKRVDDYLGNGGLFNPELMDHDKVRSLILDLRDALLAARPSLSVETKPAAKPTEADCTCWRSGYEGHPCPYHSDL